MLELGAGMSGLAGLGVAACSSASDVVLTDGNPEAVANLQVQVAIAAENGTGCFAWRVNMSFVEIIRSSQG